MYPRTPLIGLADCRHDRGQQLAEALERLGECRVCVVDPFGSLPEQLDVLVMDSATFGHDRWAALADRLPTVVIAEQRDHDAVLAAVEAGVIDYMVEPMKHVKLLHRLLLRALHERRRCQAAAHERDRLEHLNEQLETHLTVLREDLQAGGQIQRRFLPPPGQELNGVTADYWMAPSLYVSGDFLDYQAHGERYTMVCFADIAGHGASSALVTVLLKALFQRWLSRWNARSPENLPPRWLARLNRELLGLGVGKHAAIFVGVIDRDTRMLHYSLGAQLPKPLLKTAQGAWLLPGEGPAVGLFPDIEYPALQCALPESFSLWLCSDGVLDCLPGERLDERLEALCHRIGEVDTIAELRTSLALADALPDDLSFLTLTGFRHE
ncbi:serine phosphatase RsbU (regulator of sigma subunit) [Kushneria sinocarnis]|uniref:Serine phosphatase RsbU (Regulator of sigma subunit) n=1 Tax=Kushneria sinocarnis TaxID=595502 RepID=A0A420WTT7_9GAMM|nr:PP2C family protein-serine/threonine phosphatase [Kushneria sinocarnis]RKQ96400.1 serine phosphatase RsbU (regulator of sigma subunit) [Kushneria sinocarnis]